MSRYEWDPDKARINLAKHGVAFEDAATVDFDPLKVVWPDLGHDVTDQRSLLISHSTGGQLLVVVTSEGGRRPRIISAWRATKRERREYEAR